MNHNTHDPYLNTVQRALKEKEYKLKHLQAKEKKTLKKSKSFLLQRFSISELINLPEGTGNLLFFVAFILIPYIVGVSFIFVTIAGINVETFKRINIEEYTIYWAIGYEIIAFMLLMLIVKSAISFKDISD